MSEQHELANQNEWSRIVILIWDWIERLVSAFWGGIQWPHAVLIVALLFTFVFYKEIKALMPRITSVGTGGVTLASESIQSQQKVDSTTQTGTNLANLTGFGAEFPVLMQLGHVTLEQELNGMDLPNVDSFLRSNYAYWRGMYYFENTYSNIFGGQIALLRVLNSHGDLGIPFSEVQNLWDAHVQQNKPVMDSWQLDDYLSFLVLRNLAERSGNGLKIKVLGKEFLIWMTKFGRFENKPG